MNTELVISAAFFTAMCAACFIGTTLANWLHRRSERKRVMGYIIDAQSRGGLRK